MNTGELEALLDMIRREQAAELEPLCEMIRREQAELEPLYDAIAQQTAFTPPADEIAALLDMVRLEQVELRAALLTLPCEPCQQAIERIHN